MYLPNLRPVTLLLMIAVSLARPDTDMERDGTDGVGKGTEFREKRMVKTISTKLGQLGLKANRYFQHLVHERAAKKTLLADAKYEGTAITREYNVVSYRKEGGCVRALKDFRLMEAASVTIINGINFEGKVGDKPVRFIGDYQKKHGCQIKMGHDRDHGGTISVFYPEKAKFHGFDK